MVKHRSWLVEELPTKTDCPYWIVVSDKTGRKLEDVPIEAGANLKRALIQQLARWDSDGWNIESFGSTKTDFFCNKESGERMHVHLSPASPAARKFLMPAGSQKSPQ
jgi:hypothetical protein